MARAALLAVGSELLLPESRETNTLWLTRELFSLGIRVVRRGIVGDGLEESVAAIRSAREGSDLLAITGGLGPTEDDRIREALAASTGRELVRVPDLEDRVRELQARLGRHVPANALSQADLPREAEPIPNPSGTAPGIWLEDDAGLVVCLPGVPGEMKRMWAETVHPRLEARYDLERPVFLMLRTTGVPESHVGAMLDPELPAGVERTILARPGSVDVFHFCWPGAASEGQVQQAHQAARSRLKASVFAEADVELEEVVADMLVRSGGTLATAESCTGGLVAHRLTQVPGASRYFLSGWTVYSNEAKIRELGVSPEMLKQHGAVSEPVARRLAEGAVARAEADWGIGVTGIAGPGGGSSQKPVGTVHIAVARRGGETTHRKLELPGDRSEVKHRSSQSALDLLRRRLLRV